MRKHLAAGLMALALTIPPALAAPAVVASIKPIHSLVAAVMANVGTPKLIVAGNGSPHTYAMKPSDASGVQQADLVFWVGPDLENFLIGPLQTLSRPEKTIALEFTPGLTKFGPRTGGTFEIDDDGDQNVATDPHLWLDPENAKLMVGAISAALSAADPENAKTYQANAAKTEVRLDTLIADITDALAPVKGRPFVVFHDAYHYFESRFGMHAAGSIVVEPDTPPGVRRIAAIRDKLRTLNAACIFAEPEFESDLIHTVTEGSNAKIGTLDPLGAAIPDGPDLYFNLLHAMAASLKTCLAA